mgnify:CR=1 FL=1
MTDEHAKQADHERIDTDRIPSTHRPSPLRQSYKPADQKSIIQQKHKQTARGDIQKQLAIIFSKEQSRHTTPARDKNRCRSDTQLKRQKT